MVCQMHVKNLYWAEFLWMYEANTTCVVWQTCRHSTYFIRFQNCWLVFFVKKCILEKNVSAQVLFKSYFILQVVFGVKSGENSYSACQERDTDKHKPHSWALNQSFINPPIEIENVSHATQCVAMWIGYSCVRIRHSSKLFGARKLSVFPFLFASLLPALLSSTFRNIQAKKMGGEKH